MIYAVDPRQNRLFDPFEGVIPPVGWKIIANGWQGVFRHAILEVMPVGKLANHFSDSLGAPTKELFSMAGLVFLADFFDWAPQEAIRAYIFHSDVQYALNTEPGVTLCTRTLERYQQLFRDNDLAARVFDKVTTRLIEALELDVSRQRLDSTHVFSHMATFGRTKLMAIAIKRFLTQLQRHDRDAYAALPADFRQRYAAAQASRSWRWSWVKNRLIAIAMSLVRPKVAMWLKTWVESSRCRETSSSRASMSRVVTLSKTRAARSLSRKSC